MRVLSAVGLLFLLSVHPGSFDRPQTPDRDVGDPFTAPDVYPDDAPSVKSPRLIKEARPDYTSRAMRNRIEGVVKMIAIVERDGSVSAVRITQSLDPIYGLDASAVSTIKKWRFSPATRDGAPVRVRIQVEMSFTLGLGPASREPTLVWPAPFSASISRLENSVDAWAEETFAAATLQITVRYPKTWAIVSSVDNKRFTATSEDARYPRAFVVAQPLPTEADLPATMTDHVLGKMADHVKKDVAKDGDFQLRKFGQIRAPLRLWFWAELTRRLPRSPKGEDVMHLWVFTTTEHHQQVSVFCSVVEPADSYTAEMREQLNRAGADFAAMINRIGIVAK